METLACLSSISANSVEFCRHRISREIGKIGKRKIYLQRKQSEYATFAFELPDFFKTLTLTFLSQETNLSIHLVGLV